LKGFGKSGQNTRPKMGKLEIIKRRRDRGSTNE
jgi:hypothetical protein